MLDACWNGLSFKKIKELVSRCTGRDLCGSWVQGLMLQSQIHCMDLQRSRHWGKERRNSLFIILFMHLWSFLHKGNKVCPTVCCFHCPWDQFKNSTCFNHYTYCKKQMMEHVQILNRFFFPLNRNSQYYNDPFYVLMSLRLGFMGWPLITEDKQEQWCFIMLRYYHCMMQCWH